MKSQIRNDQDAQRYGYRSMESLKRFLTEDRIGPDIYRVVFKTMEIKPESGRFPGLLGLSFAEEIRASEEKPGSLPESGHIIDIRSRDEFLRGHYEKSIHVPYTIAADKRPDLPIEYYSNFDRFFIPWDLRKKTNEIVLVGSHAGDLRLIRALVHLRSHGYSKLKWIVRNDP